MADIYFGYYQQRGMEQDLEDAVVVQPVLPASGTVKARLGAVGIFDAHQGGGCAAAASKYLLRDILRTNSYRTGQPKFALSEGFEAFDEEFLRAPPRKGGGAGQPNSGCSAVVALVEMFQNGSRKLLLANVGSSRAVLLKNTGEVSVLTQEHVPELPSELTRLAQAGTPVVQGKVGGKLPVSRALGLKSQKRASKMILPTPYIFEHPIRKDDQLVLLASAPLFEHLSPEEAVKTAAALLVPHSYDLQRVCQELVHSALNRGCAQDLTVGLLLLNAPEEPAAAVPTNTVISSGLPAPAAHAQRSTSPAPGAQPAGARAATPVSPPLHASPGAEGKLRVSVIRARGLSCRSPPYVELSLGELSAHSLRAGWDSAYRAYSWNYTTELPIHSGAELLKLSVGVGSPSAPPTWGPAVATVLFRR
eukprot:RCo038582